MAMKKQTLAGKFVWGSAVVGLLVVGQVALPAQAHAASVVVVGTAATALTDSQNNSQGGYSVGDTFLNFIKHLFS